LNVAEADPWPDPIDLKEVLNELVTEINRYAVLSKHADTAIVLWIAHTYVYDAGDISPFLFLTSPEKRCGKSTVLIFLLGLVNRPMVASNISPSSIFRVIEACRPTLLIDEADTFFNENEELRGVMNSGHTKPLAYVIRTVDIGGGVFEPRQFSTWAPKAVAGIRRLADTFEDRSVIVELKRKLPGEHTERIAKFNGATIRRKLTRWARDNFEAIKCADPQLPARVYNRLADNWLPLLAITELAGAEWTDRATKALLSGMDNDSRTESAGVMLLSDLRALFNERPDPAYLATQDILEYLHVMDDRPWSAFGKFPKPITSEAMARLLKPFKIKPGQINEINARGYYLDDLKDAFDRYIPKKIPLTPIRGGLTCIPA
jgi:putative DNA primase/helicase